MLYKSAGLPGIDAADDEAEHARHTVRERGRRVVGEIACGVGQQGGGVDDFGAV